MSRFPIPPAKTVADVLAENERFRRGKVHYTAQDIRLIRAVMRNTLEDHDLVLATHNHRSVERLTVQRRVALMLAKYSIPSIDALRAWLSQKMPGDRPATTRRRTHKPAPPNDVSLPRASNGGIIPRSRSRTPKP